MKLKVPFMYVTKFTHINKVDCITKTALNNGIVGQKYNGRIYIIMSYCIICDPATKQEQLIIRVSR